MSIDFIRDLHSKNDLCKYLESGPDGPIVTFDEQLGKGLEGVAYSLACDYDISLGGAVVNTDDLVCKVVMNPSSIDACNSTILAYTPIGLDVSTKISSESTICKDSPIPEWLISDKISSFVYTQTFDPTTDNCINFLKMYDFSICDMQMPKGVFVTRRGEEKLDANKIPLYHSRERYILTMEKIDFVLSENEKQLRGYNVEFALQMFFAIAFMNDKGITHNDLHLGNVFIKLIDVDYTYNGVQLSKVDYFSYTLDLEGDVGHTYYFKATPFIVKIADFGRAADYSKDTFNEVKIIAQESIVNNRFRSLMPNFYNTVYDSVYAAYHMSQYYNIKKIQKFITNVYLQEGISSREIIHEDRPDVLLIHKIKNFSAIDVILSSGMFDHLKQKPSGESTVVSLGYLHV